MGGDKAARRLLWLCGIFALQLAAASAVSIDFEPGNPPDLDSISSGLGAWESQRDLTLDPETRNLLAPDAFISRFYGTRDHAAAIDLFAAYYRGQGVVAGPHSPRVCLPGGGWRELTSRVSSIPIADGESLPVNEYFLEKADQRILVFYWYQNQRHVWAEEFRAKLFILPDLLAHRRSDAALIRVSGRLDGAGASEAAAVRLRVIEFVRSLYPDLKRVFAAA